MAKAKKKPAAKKAKPKAAPKAAKKAASPKAAAKSAAPKAAKAGKPRKVAVDGAAVSTAIKTILIKDSSTTSAAIGESLKKQGIKASERTIGTTRAAFRHSLKVLKDKGVLAASVAI